MDRTFSKDLQELTNACSALIPTMTLSPDEEIEAQRHLVTYVRSHGWPALSSVLSM